MALTDGTDTGDARLEGEADEDSNVGDDPGDAEGSVVPGPGAAGLTQLATNAAAAINPAARL